VSLKRKIHIVLIVVLTSYVVLSWGILGTVLIPAFEELERKQAQSNLHRVENVIENELEDLATLAADWAAWEDSYRFVRGENPSFHEHLSVISLSRIDVDLMLLFDADYQSAGGWYSSLPEGHAAAVTAVFDHPLDPHDRLLSLSMSGTEGVGLLSTKLGWMLVSSNPIRQTDRQGPVGGVLIMGRLLDDERVEQLALRTEVDFQLLAPEDEPLAPELQASSLSGAQQIFLHSPDDELLLGYKRLEGMYHEPALLLEVHTPRDSSALGFKTVYLTVLFLILAGVVVISVTGVLLQHSIIRPLSQLKDHILEIRKSRRLSKRLDMQRSDEIGVLAQEFDTLTAELAVARKQRIEQTFKAGMAETAAGVLHNIRNAMTPLVNRINRASSAIEEAERLQLTNALDEIRDPDCPADRVAKLAQYLALAHTELERAHQTAQDDLGIACKQVVQVEDILAEQERLAHSPPVIEVLELEDVVQEATNVLPQGDGKQRLVCVDDSVAGHKVKANRLNLIQVLCNVLVNARESIERAGRLDGVISLEAERGTGQTENMVQLRVKDNGAGIESERLREIFQRGHTSKTAGTGGLGLHWCANTLGGMGGWLRADSAGPGEGAEFRMYLPEA